MLRHALLKFPPWPAYVLAVAAFPVPQADAQTIIGVLKATDYLSYTGYTPDVVINSPCGDASFKGGSGTFTGTKTQSTTEVTASIHFRTDGRGPDQPMRGYSDGGLNIYALAPVGTRVTLHGTRVVQLTAISDGTTFSKAAASGGHIAQLPSGPAAVLKADNLFGIMGTVFTTAAAEACPGYSFVTTIPMPTDVVVNNKCPACGVAQAKIEVYVSSAQFLNRFTR